MKKKELLNMFYTVPKFNRGGLCDNYLDAYIDEKAGKESANIIGVRRPNYWIDERQG